MFAAIRSYWAGERGRKLAGLFLFEFVVVMLGVLAAQAVANWAEERAAMSGMEEAKAKAYRQLSQTAFGLEAWDRLLPCFEDQMRAVMRAREGAAPLDADRLDRPGLNGVEFQPLSQADLVRIEERFGFEVENTLRSVGTQTRSVNERIDMVQAAWKGFALLDPQNGTPDAQDYREARMAASDILATLKGIRINTDNLLQYADALGVEEYRDVEGGRFVKDCDELWKYGTMYLYPHEMGNLPESGAGDTITDEG